MGSEMCIRDSTVTELHLAKGVACWQYRRLTSESAQADAAGNGNITAPMPGQVVELLVTEGQSVSKGQQLAILEAMKMQHQITADADGTIRHIYISLNAQVRSGDLMIEMET